MRDARARYFESNGFGDGGYDAKWVKLALGPIPFAFPNSAARVRAVRLHDLHHVATGYDTNVLGEAEIGAWEIGSSCRGFVAAWILNLYAMQLGFWISPAAVFRAFVRGRHTGNLYRGEWDEALLEARVGELRERLGLGAPAPAATAAGPRGVPRLERVGAVLLALATSALVLAPFVLLARAALLALRRLRTACG